MKREVLDNIQVVKQQARKLQSEMAIQDKVYPSDIERLTDMVADLATETAKALEAIVTSGWRDQ